MENEELVKRMEAQEIKLDKIYASMEKTRKYFLWSFVFNVAMIVLPLGAILAIIPWFLKTLASVYTIQ